MSLLARLLSFNVALVRLYWGAQLLLYPSVPLYLRVAGASEVALCVFAVVNSFRAKIDSSWRGGLVMGLYLVGYLVVPEGVANNQWAMAALIAVVSLRIWALSDLLDCYSVGPPSAIRVVDAGAYAFVRHPMQAAGVLMRLVCFLAYPSLINLGGLAIMTAAAVFVVLGEERFLRGAGIGFSEYSSRVRWRLVPLIW
jgi:protein-S-isoprenylcysteine O-methyltransferase Ste14